MKSFFDDVKEWHQDKGLPAPERPAPVRLVRLVELVAGIRRPMAGRGLPADKLTESLRQAAPVGIQRARAPPMS